MQSIKTWKFSISTMRSSIWLSLSYENYVKSITSAALSVSGYCKEDVFEIFNFISKLVLVLTIVLSSIMDSF